MEQISFDPQGIAEQRKVCDAATPGPLVWYSDALLTAEGEKVVIAKHVDAEYRISVACRNSDKVFIALSRTAYPAALTEIERLLPFEAECAALRAQVDSLTRERDAEKRRADAGAIRTAVRPFEKGDKNTLTKYTQFCKRLAASHKPEMPSEDRMLLLLTDLCIDRLCVSMQGLTVERDAAAKDLKTALTEMWIDGRGDETNICWACANAKKRDLDAWPCSSCLDHTIAEFVHRGPCADNAPEGAESEGSVE